MDANYSYNHPGLSDRFESILQKHMSPEAWNWLHEKVSAGDAKSIYTAFSAIPRKTGRNPLSLSPGQLASVEEFRKGLRIRDWTVDRLARVWLLMQLNATDQKTYTSLIENLFPAAEMNELVALYSSLPVLAYAAEWKPRCAEGIRNNIGNVLEAIMCDNPYPSEQLDEAAWNQLVLKAIFTDKPIDRIIGLDARANPELAGILSDYAHERWAAGRPVNPLLWRCVGPFINESILPDLEHILSTGNELERSAAALACSASAYPPARELVARHPEYLESIRSGKLTWQRIAGN